MEINFREKIIKSYLSRLITINFSINTINDKIFTINYKTYIIMKCNKLHFNNIFIFNDLKLYR